MWLNKIIARVIHSLAVRFKDKKKDLYILGMLESFDPNVFKDYNENSATSISLMLLYPSIMQYIQSLLYCNMLMVEGEAIPNTWCTYNYRNANLSTFLKDNKGNYIDVVKFLTEFKFRANIFLEEYEKSAKSDDLTRKYNARVLTEFHNHILEVMDVLIRSSIY